MDFFNNKFRHLAVDELRHVASLCAGAAFLLGVALVLSGAAPFLPQSIKVALERVHLVAAANAAAVYMGGTPLTSNGTAGTYTWTVPANVTGIVVTVIGGGAGGQGGAWSGGGCDGDAGQGNGGGSGGATSQIYQVTPGQQYTITVGGGGYGGSRSCGGTGSWGGGGGNSSFTGNGISLVATGGGVGQGGGSPGGGSGGNGTWYCGGNPYGGSNGTGYGNGGSSSCGGNGGGGGAGLVRIVQTSAYVGLSANPQTVSSGGMSTLTWTTSGVVGSSCTISSPNGVIGAQGVGTDVSGNGSNWSTSSGIGNADRVLDTPTDNFATLNSIFYYSPTYTKGTVQSAGLAANGYYGAVAGWQLTKGKWYWEYSPVSGVQNGHPVVGVFEDPTSNAIYRAYPGHNNDTGIGYGSDGHTYFDSYYGPTLPSFTTNDVIGVAYDADTGKVYFSKNGTWLNGGDPVAGTGYVGIVHNGYPGLASLYGRTSVDFGQYSRQVTSTFTSSGTYSVPPNYSKIKVTVVGGGGGGGGGSSDAGYSGSSGGNGGTSSFGASLSATGGGGGAGAGYWSGNGANGGNGGASGGDTNTTGGGGAGGSGGAGAPLQSCTKGVCTTYGYSTAGGNGGNGGLAVKTYTSGLSGSVAVTVGGGGGGGAGGSPGNSFSGTGGGAGYVQIVASIDGTNYQSSAGGYFTYTPPTGYKAVSTDNMPQPAVAQPSQYFNAVAYAGNGGQQAVATTFTPDLVWIKNRTAAYWNEVTDSLRGPNNSLFTNSNAAASTNDANGWVSAITSNSFTVGGQCTATPPNTNLTGSNYISWAWKKSVDSGVDVVTYTGDGSLSRQVVHSLGVMPEMVIVKRTDNTGDWYVWQKNLTDQSYYLKLDTNDAQTNASSPWGGASSGNVTSSYFTVGANATNNLNAAGATYVAYLFRSTDEFSKIGSMVGNGSTDGPVVYTGFKPKLVMVKRIDSLGNWEMYDDVRDPLNVVGNDLWANLANVESPGNHLVDMLVNGFKARDTFASFNASGGTYIYMAFADVPFKYSASNSTYVISSSLRLDAGNNAYMTRTPSNSGDRQKGTFSFWIKRGEVGTNSQIIATTPGRYELLALGFNCATDALDVRFPYAGDQCSSTLLRDPMHWYHVVVAYDSTQANASDRVKVYVDGIQSGLTGAYPAQNTNTSQWNVAGQAMTIFHDAYANAYPVDGDMADFYYIDGQQLTPSNFGAADSSGVWRPKAYSGTYGTNGFYLNFHNSVNLGADSSTNGNNFTTSNLGAGDQVADTPADTFATLDPVYYYTPSYTKGTQQGGGQASNGYYGAVAGWNHSFGNWYWEYTVGGSQSGYPIPGVFSDPTSAVSYRAYPGHNNDYGFGYEVSGGGVITQNASLLVGPVVSAAANGDVIGMAYNPGSGALYVSRNGQWQNGTNLIPQMTGPTTAGVTMSASRYYTTGYEAWRAGDRNSSGTYWYTYSHVPTNADPDWLRADFTSAQTVASYSIKNYYAALGAYDPVNWQLQGSNDGTTWTTLDTESNVAWVVAGEVKYFVVPSANRGSYTKYRLLVTGAGTPQAPSSVVIVTEWGLYSSATQSPNDGSIQPIGTVVGGWPGLASYYGKTYVNFGQGGAQTTTFADSSQYKRIMSIIGTASPSTAQYKFGGTAAYFDGASAITTPMTPGLNLSGDFTLEAWVYPTSVSGSVGILSRDSSSGYSPYLIYRNGATIIYYSGTTDSTWNIAAGQTICPSISVNTWYHVAVVRSGNTYYTFCNGVQGSTWSSSATPWPTGYSLDIGKQYSGGAYFQGYIDEVRISNSARWTSAFTPQASAYSNDANTLLLMHMDDARTGYYYPAAGGYFAYTPPTGWVAPSTANLSAPAITQPNKYFDSKAYAGSSGVPSLDPINKGTYVTLSNNNYDALSSTNCCWTNDEIYSTATFSTGKWYAEFKIGAVYYAAVGIGDSGKREGVEQALGYFPTEYSYQGGQGRIGNNNVWTTGFPTIAAGDVVMVAVDMDAGKVWFGKNGVWFGSGNPATGGGAQYTGVTGTKDFAASILASDGTVQANFGQGGRIGTTYYGSAGGYFYYNPPAGFSALPQNGTQTIGLNFAPDLVWVKNRTAAYWNTIVDSSRGANFNLFSNSNSAQTQNDINGTVTALGATGFTVGGSCAAPTGNVNATGSNYVGWVWKKSAAAGIDIQTYAGNGLATQTIAHALGTIPDFIITKRTDNTGDWYAWNSALGGGNYLLLDSSNAATVLNSPYSTDLIPTMTGNTTSGVTMSASSIYSASYAAYMAGDKNTGTYWNSATFASISAASPQWLQADLGTAQTVAAYTISIAAASPAYAPEALTLQGSNDGTTFTVLDTETPSWITGISQTFYVPTANQGSYRYYRLNITGNGGSNQVIVMEFNLWKAGTVPSATSFGVTNNSTNNLNGGAVGSPVVFTTPGATSWTAPAGVTSVQYFIVGGGGGGGANRGGGGGAGGVISGTYTVTPNTAYTVVVGAGGNGGICPGCSGYPYGTGGFAGSDSKFDVLTATGGGGGGGAGGNGGPFNGGSGGGAAGDGTAPSNAGTGIAGQGYNGGYDASYNGTYRAAGGGGGAGAAGGNGSGTVAGNGGAGVSSSLSGASATYAGGGGGGTLACGTAGTGGTGGGGTGSCSGAGGNGTANTGGGGGGAGNTGAGGNGGSGIVIIVPTYSSSQFVSYLFSNRDGFSKFGTYASNGSADGPFIYTNFRPKFVMVKDTTRSNSYTNWIIYDTARNNTDNPVGMPLYANLGNSESTGDSNCTGSGNCPVDFLANGFKFRNGPWENNVGTDVYAYAAFADVPFKSSASSTYDIPYSLHFDASSNAYMGRSFGVTGNNTTATLSVWVKRGYIGTGGYIYDADTAHNDAGFFGVGFNSSDQLFVTGWSTAWRYTTQVFRDPNRWYHVVVAVDTTQPVADDRIKVYVDGQQVTSFATKNNPSQGQSLGLNTAGAHYIGSYDGGTSLYDGYMADMYWIDGFQLPPTSFGAYDMWGFWHPIAYTSTVGTDGFHLDFSNISTTDFSGSTGSVNVGPLQKTTTYTLTCTSAAEGVAISTSTTVVVGDAGLSLTACNSANTSCSAGTTTPAFVSPGASAYLYWSAPGADSNSCTVTYPSGTLSPTNTNTVPATTPSASSALGANTTFTLSCTSGGVATSTTASVNISQPCLTGVGTAPNTCPSQCVFDTTSNSLSSSQTATLSWCCPTAPSSGVNFSTGGSATGQVSGVGVGNYQLSCPSGSGSIAIAPHLVYPPSLMTLTASPSRVRSGATTLLSWVVFGMDTGITCTMSPSLPAGLPAWDGSNPWRASATTGAITAPTIYTLSCSSSLGTSSASVNVGFVPVFQEL